MGDALGFLRVRRWDYTASPFSSRVRLRTSVVGVTIWRGTDYFLLAPGGGASYQDNGFGVNATTWWGGQQFLVGGTPNTYRADINKVVGTSAGFADPQDGARLCTRGEDPWSESLPAFVFNGDIVAIHFARPVSLGTVEKGNDELVFSVQHSVGRALVKTDLAKWRVPAGNTHQCGIQPTGIPGQVYHAMYWFRISITGNSWDGATGGTMFTDNIDKSNVFFGNGHLYSGIPPMPVFATLQNSVSLPSGLGY